MDESPCKITNILADDAGRSAPGAVLTLHVLDQRHCVTELHAAVGAPLEVASLYEHAATAVLLQLRTPSYQRVQPSSELRHQEKHRREQRQQSLVQASGRTPDKPTTCTRSYGTRDASDPVQEEAHAM